MNSHLFQYGDRVRFKCGRGWAEGIVVNTSPSRIDIRTATKSTVLTRKPQHVRLILNTHTEVQAAPEEE